MNWNTIRIRTTIILFLVAVVLLPFIVCDLYFGFTDSICLNERIQNFQISFTGNVWIVTQGLFDLGSIIAYTGLVIGFFCSKNLPLTLQWTFGLLILATAFRFTWFVVGACLYWGYLWPSSLCMPNLNVYMFIMLIINMLFMFLLQVFIIFLIWRFVLLSLQGSGLEVAKPPVTN